MAIKISGSTIIDDSRVVVNADKIGIGTPSPNRDLEILSTNATGLGVSAANSQSTNINKAISVFNAGITSTFSVSYTGIVTANEYFGTFKGDIDPGVPITNANNVNITNDEDIGNVAHYIHFGDATTGYDGVKVDSTGLVYKDSKFGLGTASPGASLHISTILPEIRLTDTDASNIDHFISGSGSALHFQADKNQEDGATATTIRFSIDSEEKLRITSDGNVGISSSAPIAKLDVFGQTELDDLNVSGVSTFAGITTVTGETLFTKQLNVAGISTFNDNTIIDGSLTVGSNFSSVTGGAPTDQGNLAVYGIGKNSLIIQTTNNANDRGIAFRNNGDAYVAYISAVNRGNSYADLRFGVHDTNNSNVDLVSERMRITREGNVGINSTAPIAKLDVNGSFHVSGDVGIGTTIPTGNNAVTSGNTATLAVGILTAREIFGPITGDLTPTGDVIIPGDLTVTNNINANGNIVGDNATAITGISRITGSTVATMAVQNVQYVGRGADPYASSFLHFNDQNVPAFGSGGNFTTLASISGLNLVYDTNNNDNNGLVIGSGSTNTSLMTTHMVVSHVGNVGIGLTNPQTLLDVQTTTEGEVARFRASNNTRYLKISSFNAEFHGSGYDFNATSTGGALSFSITGDEKLRILKTGFVGIGTTDPGSPLEIYSNNTSTNNQLRIEQDGTGDAVMGFALTGTRAYSLGIDNDDGDKFKISTATNLHTNTLFTITSDGLIGIGQPTPATTLEIKSDANAQTTATIPTLRITNDAGLAAANDITGSVEFFTEDSSDPNRISGFMRNISETNAGVNYSLIFGTLQNDKDDATEKLRIRSDGHVGIGTNNPTGVNAVTSGNTAILAVGILTARQIFGPVTGSLNTDGNVDIGGNLDVDGDTTLDTTTIDGLLDINAGGQANTFKVEDLTEDRVVIVGAGGELEDSANLTFNGSLLDVTGNAAFSGNVSIAGTLTYEDVTNIDSIGIITARKDIHVGAGLSVVGISTFNDKVGIGNTVPNATLEVNGPIKTNAGTYKSPDATGDTKTDLALVIPSETAIYVEHDAIAGIGSYTRRLIGEFGNRIEIGQNDTGIIGEVRVKPGNTGFFSVYNNATEAFRIESGGDVGIGTPNALARLDVYKGTSATDVDIFSVRSKTGAFNIQCSDTDAANPEWRLRTYSNEDIVFSPGGTGSSAEKVRIKAATGNVGIGTNNPTGTNALTNNNSTLAVGIVTANEYFGTFKGSIDPGVPITNANNVNITNDTSDSGTHYIHFGSATGGYDGVEVDSTGLIYKDGLFGVGTNNPHTPLHVLNTVALGETVGVSTQKILKLQGQVGNSGILEFKNKRINSNGSDWTTSTFRIQRVIDVTEFGYIDFGTGGSASGHDIQFGRTINSSTDRVYMHLDNSGNVGIGTDDPKTTLHVKNGGGSGFTGSYNARTSAIIEGDSSAGTTLSIMSKSSGYSGLFFGDESQEFSGQVQYIHSNNSLRILTGVGERVRINSTGVGIGTDDPNHKLHIQADNPSIALESNTTTGNTNIVFGDSGSETQGRIQYHNNGDYMRFYTNGDNERLRITSDGQFFVGVTTTSNNEKFVVDGNAKIDGNLNVTGALTYEDVTNIDSVGIITAQNGIHVTGGNVGIKTTNPNSMLSLFSDAEDTELLHFDMGSVADRRGWKFIQGSTGTGSELRLRADVDNKHFKVLSANNTEIFRVNAKNSGGYVYIPVNLLINDSIFHSGDDDTRIRFPTANTFSVETAGSDRLRIDSDGDVGIGTVSPSSKFHIHSSQPRLTMSDSDTGAHHRINADSGAGNLAFDVDYSSTTSTPAFIVNIKGDEKFRVTSAGDVGIGTFNPTGTNALTNNNTTLAVGIVTANEVYGTFKGTIDSSVSEIADLVKIASDNTGGTAKRMVFTSANSGDVQIQVDNEDGVTYQPSTGTIGAQRIDVANLSSLNHINISGITTISSGSFGNNVTVGERSYQTNVDLRVSSLRSGVVVRNMNNFRTDNTNNAAFMVLDPFTNSAKTFAFRAAEGTGANDITTDSGYSDNTATLSDTFWVKTNGDGYFSGNVGIGTSIPTGVNAVTSGNTATLAVGIVTANEVYGTFKGTIDSSVSEIADQIKTIRRDTTSANYFHFPTFVTTNPASSTAQTVFTDAGLSYNPTSNILLLQEGSLRLNGAGATANRIGIGGSDPTSATYGGIVFTFGGDAQNEKVRFVRDGSVGFGTTNPTASNINTALQSNTATLAVGIVTANEYFGTFKGTIDSSVSQVASQITVTENNDSTTYRVPFASADTGNVSLLTSAGITFRANTNKLTASGGFIGDLAGQADGADEIKTQANSVNQNRYLTFVGASTADATNKTLNTSAGIKFNPGTSSLTVGGDLSVGGSLTYEDVTNINSVGVITAQAGIHVTGGNVGIGTDNPFNVPLDVRGQLTTVATFSSLANGTQGANVSIIHTKSGITDNDKVGQISFSGGAPGSATTYAQIRAIATDISNKKGDIAFYMRNGNNTTGSLIDDERLRITSGGQLNLAGNMQFTAANAQLEMNNGGPRFFVPAANTLAIHNGGGLDATTYEVLRITSASNVGIGTTDPDGKLHISSGAGANGDCIVIIEADEDNAVESSNPQLWFKQDGDIKAGFVGQDDNSLVISSNISNGASIVFKTGTTDNRGTDDPLTGATEKLRIAANGALAVGGAANYGTSGQVLTSNGNAAPSWQAAGASGISVTTTSTNTTLVIGDVGKLKLATGTGDQFTVPASVFSPGNYVSFHNQTTGIINIVTATNVTIYLSGSNISVSSGSKVKLSPRALATLTCIVGGSSPQFVISGGGVYI